MSDCELPVPQKEKSLRTRVLTWLETQGYPLEMKVAHVFQRLGFRIIQSGFYEDPETGQAREIDVIAVRQREIRGILFRVSIVIECKFAKDKPWLLFLSSNGTLAGPARVAQRIASPFGERLLSMIAQNGSVQDLPLFHIPEPSGYGLTQAFTSGQDVCFSAATSVAKAALARAIEGNPRRSRVRPSGFCEIAFPAIVIDGCLFGSLLNQASGIEVSEMQEGTLLWRNPVAKIPHTIISVFTVPCLEPFAERIHSSIESLFKLCETDLQKVVEETEAEINRAPLRVI